jgi:hypothetical protein
MRIILLLLLSTAALSQNPCSRIKRHVDKFNGNVSYESPFHYISVEHPIRMRKVYYKKTESWGAYFSMLIRTSGFEAGETTVDLLFEDGTNWERRANPTYYRETYNNVYDAEITLSTLNLQFMSENRIKAYRFYGYTRNLNSIVAEKIKRYATCMLSITDP